MNTFPNRDIWNEIEYANKANLEKEPGVDKSNFVKKTNLTSLKSEIDKLDIGKLETYPVDLSKLSDVVKH